VNLFESAPWLQLPVILGLEVAVIVGAAAAVQRVTRSAGWHRVIWQAALLALGLVVAMELAGVARGFGDYAAGLWPRNASQSPSTPASPIPAAPRSSPATVVVAAREDRRGQAIPSPAVPAHAARGQAPASPAVGGRSDELWPVNTMASNALVDKPGSRVAPWLLGLSWLLGCAVLAGRAVFCRCMLMAFHLRCERCQSRALDHRVGEMAGLLGLHRPVGLLRSPKLASPVAFGLVRPVIGLPMSFEQDFDSAQQEAILAHELAHLAARDPAWHLLSDLVAAALWWHPLVWWARWQLLEASEAAADDASLVLQNGQHALADSLVRIASRLASSPSKAGWIGVGGHRFTSGLGRRVQRLLALAGERWHPPGRPTWRLARAVGPAALALTALLCTAWVVPHASMNPPRQQGETLMKTMQTSWHRSAAVLALAAILGTDQPRAVAANSSPAAKALPSATPSTGSAASTSWPVASPAKERKGEDAIRAKLAGITLETVFYDSLPLSEVVKNLVDVSAKQDPDKVGVNFLFQRSPSVTSPIDPATGLPVESLDLGSISVRVSPPLKNVRMLDMLEVLGKTADHPIDFTITEYAVVISAPKTATPALRGRGTPGMRALKAKLDSIVLDEVMYDSLPLGEIVRMLNDQALKRDPAKEGVNFILASSAVTPGAGVDPATGLPRAAQETIDLSSIAIRIVPRLKQVRLSDVLDAILKAADRPIQCTIEDYAVVFAVAPPVTEQKPSTGQAAASVAPVKTSVRVFHMENAGSVGLGKTFGMVDKPVKELSPGDFHRLWATLGLAEPLQPMFYNPNTQTLMVRAPAADLEVFEAAMLTLGAKVIGLGTGSANLDTGADSEPKGAGVSSPGTAQANHAQVLVVSVKSSEPYYWLGSKSVSLEGLQSELEAAKKLDTNVILYIRTESDAPNQALGNLIQTVKKTSVVPRVIIRDGASTPANPPKTAF
jgi:beta-lactamase regulating signal transducer with metallopeptidase domain